MNDYLKKRQHEKLYGKPKVEKKTYRIPKQSEKKKKEIAERKEAGSDNSLDRWFEERRKDLTGKCCLCGGRSEKGNDETYRRSIHHLLDKRKSMFPSLALRPENFLEVCFHGNSCHQNIHGGKITWELLKDSKEWDIIKPKLEVLLPMCTEQERKNKLYSKLIELVYGTSKV